MTVLSTLVSALAWPSALLALTNFIDSKWTIAVDRFAHCYYSDKRIYNSIYMHTAVNLDIRRKIGYKDLQSASY